MDDFGDFFQAAAPNMSSPSHALSKPGMHASVKQPVDLNSKIMASFDLSGTNHKADFSFQRPSTKKGKRPQNSHFQQSSTSADWKSLNLETSEFMAPVRPVRQPHPRHNNYVHSSQASVPSQHFITPRHSQANIPRQFITPINQNQAYNQSNIPSRVPFHTNPRQPGVQASNITPAMNSQGVNFPNNPAVVGLSPSTSQFSQSFCLNNSGQLQPGNYPNIAAGNQNLMLNVHADVNFIPGLQPNASNNIYATVPPIKNESSSLPGKPAFQNHGPSPSCQGSESLPKWMTHPSQIPPLYKQVLKLCATPNSFADTSKLYPIFLSSDLPTDVLGHIWSSANQSSPGQLTFTEMYIALALIALAQTGELNLTVGYVLKLPVAPIPKLKLPQDISTPMKNDVGNVLQDFSLISQSHVKGDIVYPSQMGSANMNKSLLSSLNTTDDFSDFQSFANASSSSIQKETVSQSDDFEDFQSFTAFTGSSDVKASVSQHPDRNLINSPKFVPKDPPKPLLGGIDFSKFNNDSSKTLHSATKILNISSKSSVSTTKDSVVSNLSMQNVRKSDDFMDFKTGPKPTQDIFDSIHSSGFSAFQTGEIKSKPALMGSADKYAALRDVMPIAEPSDDNTSNKGTSNNEKTDDEDFAEFQSVPSQNPMKTIFGANLAQKQDHTSPISFFDKGHEIKQEDTQSITSLELPNLSKTTSKLSVNSSPALSNDLFSLKHAGNAATVESFNLHQSQPSIFSQQSAISGVATVAGNTTSSEDNHKPDDGLYDLDEPISPVSRKKYANSNSPNKITAKSPDPISPPKPKRFVVPKMSDSDDDFADFSFVPPPIDDDYDDHHDEMQEGDSSLADFDAFGHLEEAKLEKLKKKEAAFKRTKEDATAFSDFVKSSVIDLKPTVHVETGTSPSDQEFAFETEEGSSAINDDAHTASNSNDTSDTNETTFHIDSDKGSITTWKLEPTVSETDWENSLKDNQSKWDQEGEELKARMEGVTNPMESFIDHWSRCLAICKDIIVSTSDIFAALNSPSVCLEVVNSTRGKEFISCTSEVYGVARRIKKGMEVVGLEDDDLKSCLKEIEFAWNNLLGFCPYTPSVHKTPEHKSYDRENTQSACSLCLLSKESNEVDGLKYCGRFYHAPCANLWLNQIAPILPRLTFPVS